MTFFNFSGKDKKSDELSSWARIRDTDDEDGFVGIARIWSEILDRWDEGFEGKVSIVCMVLVIGLFLAAGALTLGIYLPTFDPTI